MAAKSQTKAAETKAATTDAPQPPAQGGAGDTAGSAKGNEAGAGTDVLEVTARQDRRRRAGFAFGRAAVRIPLGDLKADQIAAIEADPQLVATRKAGGEPET
ncbi:hypothetical protein HW532_19115 [Kaustia mangrovi]|uniref:Mu-like prophage FluMu N-terminal domain-containing protein n=1 Tax=Kaustia mangrovi TaxID=2593653 RepID=A0A7S8C766_9HYPH|nr:hypothetical protein [Kaustia mangrovi]QPC44627.1 hypothetical protein HW532_19115 [Kaustia mangrovi]